MPSDKFNKDTFIVQLYRLMLQQNVTLVRSGMLCIMQEIRGKIMKMKFGWNSTQPIQRRQTHTVSNESRITWFWQVNIEKFWTPRNKMKIETFEVI